jgi:hypothetical protein
LTPAAAAELELMEQKKQLIAAAEERIATILETFEEATPPGHRELQDSQSVLDGRTQFEVLMMNLDSQAQKRNSLLRDLAGQDWHSQDDIEDFTLHPLVEPPRDAWQELIDHVAEQYRRLESLLPRLHARMLKFVTCWDFPLMRTERSS